MRQCKNEFQNPDRKNSWREKPQALSMHHCLPDDLLIALLDVTGKEWIFKGDLYINRYT